MHIRLPSPMPLGEDSQPATVTLPSVGRAIAGLAVGISSRVATARPNCRNCAGIRRPTLRRDVLREPGSKQRLAIQVAVTVSPAPVNPPGPRVKTELVRQAPEHHGHVQTIAVLTSGRSAQRPGHQVRRETRLCCSERHTSSNPQSPGGCSRGRGGPAWKSRR